MSPTLLTLLALGAVAIGLRVFIWRMGRKTLEPRAGSARRDEGLETVVSVLGWTFGLGLAFAFFSAGAMPILLSFWLPGVLGGLLVSLASAVGLVWAARRERTRID